MKRVTGAGPGCPHLLRAADGKLPKAWTLRRTAAMGETYRCADRQAKPPVNRRKKAAVEDVPMFDAPAEPVGFVPVEGWPSAADFGKAAKDEEGDHQ